MLAQFLIRRILVTALVIASISIIAFSLVHLSGDPAAAMAGEGASPEDIEVVRELYGLNQPFYQQYVDWLGKIFSGNFGHSYYLKQSVSEVLLAHAPITATLGITALIFALVLSIPLGVLAALRPNTMIDRMALGIAVAGQAMPSFLSGLGLIYLFGVHLRWLPVSGSETWQSYLMPAVCLGYYATPALMRLTRSGMMEALQADHVRTCRAFGLHPWRVVVRHAFRHAMIPLVSLSAVQLGFMLGGSIIVETVFSLKGLGYLAWQSIHRSDIEVIQALLLGIAVVYCLLTLFADILNAGLDPKLRTI